MLNLMGYSESKSCPLCNHYTCNLFHILSNCSVALKERYSWRHDSVLETLKPILESHLKDHNDKNSSLPKRKEYLLDHFVKAGDVRIWPKVQKGRYSWLSGFSDWELLVDFHCEPILFPPFICATDQRPDINIFSVEAKHIIMIELTCPAEENMDQAKSRKIARYAELQELISQNDWSSKLITIEIGTRGLVSTSVHHALRGLGFTPQSALKISRVLSLVTARCSYAIWLKHQTPTWEFSLGHEHLVKVSL
mmetsp:Transcript_23314/g.29266  ORF Transcript_23314/g.29266 Transcript_23314/m.29266 type:complete len:251 (+) Transcript_23314:390-1142(+)